MSITSESAIETEIMALENRLAVLRAAQAALKACPRNVAQPKPGDRMPDGTVYVGVSPSNGRPFYAMPQDLPDLHTWDCAQSCAAAQTFGGHTDWRVPTRTEFDALYRAQEAIGGFQRDWYWSSSELNSGSAWAQVFSDGEQPIGSKVYNGRVRCVRSG